MSDLIHKLAEKLSLAGFVETSFDGFGKYPETEKLERVLREAGLGEILEVGERLAGLADSEGFDESVNAWRAAKAKLEAGVSK